MNGNETDQIDLDMQLERYAKYGTNEKTDENGLEANEYEGNNKTDRKE